MDWRVPCRSLLKAAPALALSAGVLALPGQALAATCMSHKALVSYLTEKFDESPRALGLVASRNVMEVFVSEKGTWTIVMTSTRGVACIVAAGDTWEDIDVALNTGVPEY